MVISVVWKLVDLMRGAGKLVRECADVQSDEEVMVLTDTATIDIAMPIASAANEVAGDVVVSIMRLYGRRYHGEEPPKSIAQAMKLVDVLFAPVEWSIYHTKARQEASKAGVRCFPMTHADEDMLVLIGESPFLKMKPVVNKVEELLMKASSCHITSPAGTDIKLDLSGRSKNIHPSTGICHKGDKRGVAGPPNIEANISPVEDVGDGVVVVDATNSMVGSVTNPITLRFEKGRIKSIEGHDEARKLREILEKINDPNIYRIAEFGIGLNPKARMRGRTLEDEAVYGSAHIATGSNLSFGGNINAKGHDDNTFWYPTIKLDGKIVMKDGKLTIKDIPKIEGIYVK